MTRYINLAVAQVNPRCGDIGFNRKLIYDAFLASDAELIVFPECVLTGYPNEDLVLNHDFMDVVEKNRKELIEDIYKSGRTTAVIFGSPERRTIGNKSKIFNGAYFVDPVTKTTQIVYKTELPNYGVFDEKRIFTPNRHVNCVTWKDLRVGLMICEDAWHERVALDLYNDGADFFVSINGSPYEVDKQHIREAIVQDHVKKYKIPFVYVNMVGGQDEIVFDGQSFAIDSSDNWFQFGAFNEVVKTIDFDVTHVTSITPSMVGNASTFTSVKDRYFDIYAALVLGTRDYLAKQGFTSTIIGYSGGVDSGLVAAISCDAIGADKTNLVRLPSKYSSQGSLDDAQKGADRLGAPMRTIPIEPVVEALRAAYEPSAYDPNSMSMLNNSRKNIGTTFDTINKGNYSGKLTGIADENIQARARGNILMAISNQEGHILLTTGNKSEVSVGYSTLYGDMAGGFNPIKDAYKTLVWELCRWRNNLTAADIKHYGFLGKQGTIVPEEIINKPPSAELRPDQKDEDSLPPYPVLDAVLEAIIEGDKSNSEIVDLGFDIDLVKRIRGLVYRSEYKRRQAAPGIKITSKLHGRDRRFPIVNGILRNT